MLKKINNITLAIGSVVMAVSYFPQILQIITTKSSQGVSLAFMLMVTFAIATFTLNGYVIYKESGDASTLRAQLANLLPAIILCVFIIVFR